MERMERGFRKKFKLKKVFSIILVSYFAMLMVPAALAIGFSVSSHQLSEKRSMEEVMNNIQQGQLLFEDRLQAMDSNVMYLSYDYTLRRMLKLEPLKPGDENVWFITEFHKRLNDIFADSSILNAYCLFLKNEYVFYSGGVTQGREFYYQYSRSYENLSYEEWRQQSFFAEERILLPLSNIKCNQETVSAITYSYPVITSMKESGEADAVVQFLIREEDLRSFFLPLLNREGCHVLLLDGSGGEMAMLTDGETREISFSLEDMTEPAGSVEAAIGEEKAVLVYRRSEKNDLIVSAVLPEAVVLEDARRLWATSLIMMIISMLFELALGIYFAWKYSAPVKNLIRNVYLMVNPNQTDPKDDLEGRNEYEHLESGINQIIETNRSMQMTLKEKQEREKDNFLSYLFSGEFRENEDIVREGALIGLELDGLLYCVTSFAMEEPKQGAEILQMKSWQNVLAVYAGKQNLSVLFGFKNETEKKELEENIREMEACLEETLGKSYRIGVGRVYQNERDIHFSYKQSLYSAKISKGMVTFYSNISQDFNSLFYPTELENKLVNSTKHGELRQIQQVFVQIREENLEKRCLSGSMGRILVSNVAATLIRVYNDVIPDEKLDQMVNDILLYSDFSEALVVLEQQFIHIGEELAHSRDEREESYQKRLAEYVEQNYSNPQLGVAMAAEAFTLSENYFSQFFKEVMKESFSTYLETLRLNKAKELIDKGEYNLEQIAGMVGYQNSGTFRRAFKRVTGISPSAWKTRE